MKFLYLLLAILFGLFFLFGLLLLMVGMTTRNPDGQHYGMVIGIPVTLICGFLVSFFWKKMYLSK